MDLIGRIQHMESRLGERRHEQRKRKPARSNARDEAADEKNVRADEYCASGERDTRVGGKLDIAV